MTAVLATLAIAALQIMFVAWLLRDERTETRWHCRDLIADMALTEPDDTRRHPHRPPSHRHRNSRLGPPHRTTTSRPTMTVATERTHP